MAAIAMMALALFSCKKNDEPKKAENAVLRIRINDAELRNLEKPVEAGTVTTVSYTHLTLPTNREV